MYIVAVLLLVSIRSAVDGYAVCGNSSYKALEVKKAADEIVDRFMQLRSPDWLWESISTITTIQIAAPKRLFGRNKIERSFRELIREEFDNFHLIDVAEMIFAARSLCINPAKIGQINLLEAVHDNMDSLVKNVTGLKEELEVDHVIDFSLALSSLCIADYPMDPNLVAKLLMLQNDDGSFGPKENAAEATISMLRPIYCLSRMPNALFSVANVTETVKKMRNYIMTLVTPINDAKPGVYIGPDAIASINSLVALYKTMEDGEDPNEKWRCREVVDTLGLKMLAMDDEIELQERLMMLTAVDYLDMQGSDYKCVNDVDPIPEGYKPKCNYENPETCAPAEEELPK